MPKKIILTAIFSCSILISGCSVKNAVINNNIIIGSDVISNPTTTANTTKKTEKNQSQDRQYKFVKNYSTMVTVGGIVGITKKSYQIGDIITGQVMLDGIKTRIAPHSARNEGEPNSASYQEFITIPIEYLQLSAPINIK